MKELYTLTPNGLNNNCESKDRASLYKESDIVNNLFSKIKPLKGRLRDGPRFWGTQNGRIFQF